MSVFEQCLPYRELGLKDLTCEVLNDDEDILTQISAQLEIPSFVGNDESKPGVNNVQSSYLPPIEGLETGILDDMMMMDDLSNYNYPDSGFSDCSIKSEPCSPSSSSNDHSPPLSPVHPVTGHNLVTTNIITQPTVAVNTINSFNSINNANISIPTNNINGKVPIPKLVKSTVATPAPLVTTLNNTTPAPFVFVCNQAPTNGPIIVKTEPVQSNGFGNPLITGVPTVTGHSSAEDLRNLKRQQRMIKNRESACISRKKKKEYVSQLEDQIKSLSNENLLLRNENEQLKERLRQYESGGNGGSVNGKKATALLAMLFMVSLNMGSLSSIYNSNENDVPTNLNNNVHVKDAGRTLLWVDETLESSDNKEYLSNITNFTNNQCGSNLNQTESIRLESDLRGWFNIEPSVNKRRPDITRRPSRVAKRKVTKNYPVGNVVKTPLHSLTGSVYHMLLQQEPVATTHQNALSFYNNYHKNSFSSFFDAIERRDDTFYVVSFSGDHLLVPATNHTKSSQPLMSLMLPAVVSSNSTETNQSDSIAMMKIDCQVINTQMVHIMKDAIPVHMSSGSDTREEKTYDDSKVYKNYRRNPQNKADNRTFTQTLNEENKNSNKYNKKKFSSN